MKSGKIFFFVALFLWLVTQVQPGMAQKMIGPHGYLTFEAEISSKDSVGRRGTFDLHHFNVLGDYLLNQNMRVFGEIEWEHGTDSEAYEPGGTQAGFVRLERAWFEYEPTPGLKLRFGKFLTPYGIYNEIHDAAPAYDTSILPQSIYGKHMNPFGRNQRFYAKFSIGIQLLSKIEIGESFFEFKTLLSNGRGKKPFEQDDNADKGIGFRLLGDIQPLQLKIGYSFYTDKNGAAFDTRQTSHAIDLRFERNRWRWTVELARSSLQTPNGPHSSRVANAGYAELAYHISQWQTLIARYDLFDPDQHLANELERDFTLGTSIYLLKQVVVKAEVHFWHQPQIDNENYLLAISSLAVVF
ncbi:MAG: hypothetical protein D6814_12290 [Calditrichaeota bacterium]|nr:MAG: hypothetical protein D6814_12290 [Calditrichota bacterium]